MQDSNAKFQYMAALVVALYGIQYGMFVGWSSPNIVLLTSKESPLPSGKITTDEATWTTALKSLGFLLTCTMFGFVANSFGRKWPMWILSFPLCMTWLMIIFAQNVYYIYVARFIQGVITAGIFSISQFYFVEISNDRARGLVSSTVLNTSSLGILIAYVLGTYCSYSTTPAFGIAITVLFAVLFFFFPETPTFLLKNNRIEAAEKSIRFYHNLNKKTDIKLIQEEIERLKNQIGNYSKFNDWSSEKSDDHSFKWQNLIRNPGRKALIIGIVLALLNHVSGNFALINYAGTIFKEAGSVISENESTIVVGVILCFSTFISPLLISNFGRKVLYTISCFGSTICFICLGVYMILKSRNYDVSSYSWISIVSLSAVIFIQSLGVSSMSLMVTAEIMPTNIREFGITFCNTIMGIAAFLVLKVVLPLSEQLGLGTMVFCFAASCFVCGIFIVFVLPETKGKSQEEIVKALQ